MDLLQLTPVVALAALLGAEAVVLLTAPRRRFPWWFPCLLVAVAGFGVLFSLASLRGWLVVSPELGLVMIEGGARAYWSIAVLTLACAISVGLLVPAVGQALNRPASVRWSLLGAAVVVALVIADIRTLNPADSAELRIAAYDLWSPPLTLWLTLSLVESALRVLDIRRRAWRLCAHAFALAAVAMVAAARHEFLQKYPAFVWGSIALVAVVASAGLAPLWMWSVRRRPGESGRPPGRVLAATVGWWTILGVVVWMWLAFQARQRLVVLVEQALSFGWTLWAATLLAVAGWLAWGLRQPPILAREPVALLLAHAILAIGLFSVQVFEPSLVTVTVFASWIILAESTADGALVGWVRKLRTASPTPGTPLWRLALDTGWTKLWEGLKARSKRVGETFTKSTVIGGVLKALLAIIVLIALAEVPNAGTTIIGTFSVQSGAKQKDLGQAVADHLVFALHSLNERLRPDMALVASAGTGTRDRGFKFVAARDEATSLDSELAKRPDVDFGPLKVPLNLLAAPIRGPARQVLGVRVISGAVHESSPHNIVLARSTSGEAWKVPLETSASPPNSSSAPVDADAARALAHRLAIEIVTSDRSSTALGLTRSPEALESFEKGWVEWRRFEIDDDLRVLNEAIRHFREATTKDRRFALAHYRLARALQRAGRPGAATEAFRASLQVNAHFGPGLVGLASTLYDYDAYLTAPPAAVRALSSGQIADDNPAALFRKGEAVRLWQKVIRAPAASVSSIDRASAYAGLCLRASDLGSSFESARYALEEVGRKLENFSPREAHRVWVEWIAADRAIRESGKPPTPQELQTLERLQEERQRALEPVDLAEEAAVKTLNQLDALGADDARGVLERVRKMLLELKRPLLEDEAVRDEVAEHVTWQLITAASETYAHIPTQSSLTYFYCKRADKIYSSLADMRTDPDLRAGAARVAFLLGDTLERRQRGGLRGSWPQWRCMVWPSLRFGPYNAAVLRHYDRAIALFPDDASIRCHAALTAYGLGDTTRLRALEQDSDSRLNLAEQHLADAWWASGRWATAAYRNAQREYSAAIERNPNSIDALNGYAYTFWLWRYARLQEVEGVDEPEADVGERARAHAERAVQLVEGKRAKREEIFIRSTLGEVLLGLGHFEKARDVLQRALEHASVKDMVKDHAYYNEVRWDLAQAHMCIANERLRTGRDGSSDEPRGQADKLFDEIRRTELSEEARPFSTLLDGSKKGAVCLPPRPLRPARAAPAH
jgi:tetratricopeptide (TPR) repeat protein